DREVAQRLADGDPEREARKRHPGGAGCRDQRVADERHPRKHQNRLAVLLDIARRTAVARRHAGPGRHGARRLPAENIRRACPEVVAEGGDGDERRPWITVPNQREQRRFGTKGEDGGREEAPAGHIKNPRRYTAFLHGRVIWLLLILTLWVRCGLALPDGRATFAPSFTCFFRCPFVRHSPQIREV